MEIVYVATGKSFVKEAINSGLQLKSCNQYVSLFLFTDQISSTEYFTQLQSIFDHVFILDSPSFSYRDKILGIQQALTKLESFLFLDTDTYVLRDIQFLHHDPYFDFAACHAPVRIPQGCEQHDVPPYFPEFNSGVMFFRNGLLVNQLVSYWLERYDSAYRLYSHHWDQYSLRASLWQFSFFHQLKIHILPPEFNLRLTKPWIAGKGLPVYIVHGRISAVELPTLTDYLNDDIHRFRTWVEWKSLYPSTSLSLKIPYDPFLS